MPPSPVPPRPAEKEASRGQPRRERAPVPAQQLGQEPEQGERVTVGDFLVDSLTAQSLDLPPQAAKVHSSRLCTVVSEPEDAQQASRTSIYTCWFVEHRLALRPCYMSSSRTVVKQCAG